MYYRIELCDLKKAEIGRLLVEIAGKSLQNSEWTLQGGLRSSHFFDVDLSYSRDSLPQLSKLISNKIKELSDVHGCSFDKVAFIEKGERGPVGLIGLMGSISPLIEKGVIIVRPSKWLLRSSIKGEVKKSDSFLIISDVATTGETIFSAAEKIWAFGGKVPYALVVIDRMQGATENLIRKGIQLYSLTSAQTLQTEKGEEIASKFNRSISTDFEPHLKDFGGSSITTLG